jgi:hypothetical protein
MQRLEEGKHDSQTALSGSVHGGGRKHSESDLHVAHAQTVSVISLQVSHVSLSPFSLDDDDDEVEEEEE